MKASVTMQNMPASAQSDCAVFCCAEMNTALLLDAILMASIFICLSISISVLLAMLGLLLLIAAKKSVRSMTPISMAA